MTDDLSIDDETPPLLAVADSDIIVKVYKLHLLEQQQLLIQGFGVTHVQQAQESVIITQDVPPRLLSASDTIDDEEDTDDSDEEDIDGSNEEDIDDSDI